MPYLYKQEQSSIFCTSGSIFHIVPLLTDFVTNRFPRRKIESNRMEQEIHNFLFPNRETFFNNSCRHNEPRGKKKFIRTNVIEHNFSKDRFLATMNKFSNFRSVPIGKIDSSNKNSRVLVSHRSIEQELYVSINDSPIDSSSMLPTITNRCSSLGVRYEFQRDCIGNSW